VSLPWTGRRSSSCSMAPRASLPMEVSSSARPPACGDTSSRPASTRVGSRTRAGPAARSRNGSSEATCRWTSGRWTLVASPRSTVSRAFSPSACARCRAFTTVWRGRSASTRRGAGAERALQWLAAGDVAVPVGRTVYTPLLNERGGYESDLTISRIAPDTFFVVTSSAQRVRDADWIRSNLPRDAKVTLADVTEEHGTFSLMGPLSREVLARATRARLDNAAFPYGSVRDIDVAGVTVRAVRLSYVGELGWELYVATAQA